MAECKYYKQVRQVSYDSGVTWISLDEYQKGDLYENDSPDCGGGITQYKWVNVSGEYTCVGTTKYQKTKKQQSTDGGQTWTDVNPPEYNIGGVIERESSDCGGGSDYSNQYLTLVARGSGTFVANKYTSSSTAQYSKDNGSSWISLTSTSTNISVSSGDRVMFKGLLEQSSSSEHSPFVRITGTTQYEIEGNIMSLIYGDNFRGQTSFPNDMAYSICEFTYASSDRYNPYLTSIDNLVLPATTLYDDCYISMFYHCTSITSVPSGFLPATTLANECYAGMFWGCTSLTSVPSDLLPATTLPSKGCYAYMFADTKITRAPDLPAPILPPYSSSVSNDYCYGGMFQNCSRLNYIKCLATSGMGDYTTWNWVDGVSSSGTFVKASNATWSRGASGIPNNWTVQNA